VTALVFDKNMQYIYGGNDVGEFWRLSLKDFTIESGQNQIGRIFSITMSSDGKYVATGSGDGSVGVYETGPDWNQNSILILEQKECDRRKVFSVAFSEDNRLIYAAYDDGTVLNWPANADILAELIKAQVKGNLDYKMWNKYIKPSFEKQYLDNKIDKSYLKKYQ
jgi:WD40 repeat protein